MSIQLAHWFIQINDWLKGAAIFLIGILIKSPLPEGFFRALLSKGAFPMSNPALNAFFGEVQAAAKVVVANIEGSTPDEKANNACAFLEPYFNEGLAALNVSPFLDKVADGLFEMVVKAEVKALAS